jgi:alpha-galactosidase
MAALALALLACGVAALPNGPRTPPMGFNSWTAFGTGVSESLLLDVAAFLNSSGLRAGGYQYVNSDDGWSLSQRDANGTLVADPAKVGARP